MFCGDKHLLTDDSMNTHVDVTCSFYLAEEFPCVSAQFMSQDCPKHFYYLTHKMY